jgi:predicted XRE-type DNA-binding protein
MSNETEMEKESNIVKRVCKELDITQKELAEMLEVSPASVSDWAKGQIPKMTQLALEQMLELKSCKEKLKKIKEAHDIIGSL